MNSPATFAEIAEALKRDKRSIERRALKEAWKYTEAPAPGKPKRLFALADLPPEVCAEIKLHRMHAAETVPTPAETPASPAAPATPTLPATAAEPPTTERQREIKRARQLILRYVHDSPLSIKKALARLNEGWTAGTLPGPLALAMEHAHDKGAPRPIAVKTYWNWVGLQETRGAPVPRRRQKDFSVKPWHALFFELVRRPQGSALTWVAEQIAAQWQPEWGPAAPDYHAVRRHREKCHALDLLKGRHTGSQLRAQKFCHRRTADGLNPMDEVHADGWATHFTAPHPVSQEWVTLEVWHFHDFATRYAFKPSVGFSESFLVIAAGLYNVVEEGGMPAVVLTDHTSSVKNDRMADRLNHAAIASIERRGGFTITHPKEVGNSQANGVAENFNKYLDKRSKELATYQHESMDRLAFKRVQKITAKMAKAAQSNDLAARAAYKKEAERMGKGRVFDSYPEAVEWINRIVDEFNDRPHRFLPKIRDPQTGKLRHQTPREAWNLALAQGWQPVKLDAADLTDLFQPHEVKTVQRGAVTIDGKRYRHSALDGYETGTEVLVAYNVMDWTKVRVKALDGSEICEAEFYQAKTPRPQSAYDRALEKRADAQQKRLARKSAAIESQRPGVVLDLQASPESEALSAQAKVLFAQAGDAANLIQIPVAEHILDRLRGDEGALYDLWHQLDGEVKAGGELTDPRLLKFHKDFWRTSLFKAQASLRQNKGPQALQR